MVKKININKWMLVITIGITCMLMLFVAKYDFAHEELPTEVFHMQGNTIIFEDIDSLHDEVDVVIHATVLGNSKNIDFPETEKESPYQLDSPYGGYVITEVEVNKIYKDFHQPFIQQEEQIFVVEPMYKNLMDGEEILVTFNDYIPLMEGDRYVMFLSWEEDKQLFGIFGLNQGKYNLSTPHEHEIFHTHQNHLHQELYEQVIQKYMVP